MEGFNTFLLSYPRLPTDSPHQGDFWQEGRAVFWGQNGCFDGHLETQEGAAEQHSLMRKVPFRVCEYIYGSGQREQGTLAGDHMLRDKACALLSYQGVPV